LEAKSDGFGAGIRSDITDLSVGSLKMAKLFFPLEKKKIKHKQKVKAKLKNLIFFNELFLWIVFNFFIKRFHIKIKLPKNES